MLSRVVFGVVLSGGVVRVVRSVRSGNGAAGGATLWGRYTKKKRPVLMATASASVINTLSHLFSISKNLNFAKIAEKPEPHSKTPAHRGLYGGASPGRPPPAAPARACGLCRH